MEAEVRRQVRQYGNAGSSHCRRSGPRTLLIRAHLRKRKSVPTNHTGRAQKVRDKPLSRNTGTSHCRRNEARPCNMRNHMHERKNVSTNHSDSSWGRGVEERDKPPDIQKREYPTNCPQGGSWKGQTRGPRIPNAYETRGKHTRIASKHERV